MVVRPLVYNPRVLSAYKATCMGDLHIFRQAIVAFRGIANILSYRSIISHET